MSYKQALASCASILAIGLGLGRTASAQEVSTPKYEIGLLYSGLHVNSSENDGQRTGNGGSGYFEYNLNRTLGLVADFGGYANAATAKESRLFTYMFGPRFNWRHSRWTPYAQALFGGGHLWTGSNYNNTKDAFSMAIGGGVDYRLTDHIAIKPVQVEYVLTRFDNTNGFGDHQNDIRYSAGVVFRLGSK
jgi:opacity protein-like surface antigen